MSENINESIFENPYFTAPVLVALMGDVPLAHALRYFLMAAAGAALWPMTFRFYAGKQ